MGVQAAVYPDSEEAAEQLAAAFGRRRAGYTETRHSLIEEKGPWMDGPWLTLTMWVRGRSECQHFAAISSLSAPCFSPLLLAMS